MRAARLCFLSAHNAAVSRRSGDTTSQVNNVYSQFTYYFNKTVKTEALLLAEDRPFWRTIATAGGFS